MRLSKISIKVFTNILLELGENFEKILGGFPGILCKNNF